MGKIIETKYHDTVEKITGFNSTLINNSFYTLNDKKPTIVTYYNIDRSHTSLDPGSKLAYDNIGKDSPIRYNKVEDFIIYGFTRIELQTDNDEFGLEADKISGECYVMPNTIIPTEGDYFEVPHITDSTWLFMISDVQKDTLENGSNAYKLTYKLEYVDHNRILDNIVDNYKMIEKREGTNVAKVVKSDKLDHAKLMDKIAVMLKGYYNELFYNEYVQTFTYMDLTEYRIYDPCMIEFLIRNKILDNGEDSYIHVCHQLEPIKTFTLEYNTTFFRAFEKIDKELLSRAEFTTEIEEIFSYGTTFASRFEPYFKAKYIKPKTGYRLEAISQDLIYRILDNKIYNNTDPDDAGVPKWKNVLIKYMNKDYNYTKEELYDVENMHFDTSTEAFYSIPLLILCLEYAIEKLLD